VTRKIIKVNEQQLFINLLIRQIKSTIGNSFCDDRMQCNYIYLLVTIAKTTPQQQKYRSISHRITDNNHATTSLLLASALQWKPFTSVKRHKRKTKAPYHTTTSKTNS